jgi:hypothetical protein
VSAPSGGALPDTAVAVSRVAVGAGQAAERAAGIADAVRSEVQGLLLALGGGPPAQLREADVLAASAATALGEAAGALQEAVTALRAFTGRTT